MTRLSLQAAKRLAIMAGQNQDIEAELRGRDVLAQGLKLLRPNRGESLFLYALRTIGQDVMEHLTGTDCPVFPEPDDRRCDFSFLPVPLVVEVHGSVHQEIRVGDERWANKHKLERDCAKENDYQLHGIMVLKFTPEQLRDDPCACMDVVRRGLTICRDRPPVAWAARERDP